MVYVVGSELTLWTFSEGTGEPWKDFEQGRNRVSVYVRKIPQIATEGRWKEVELEPGAQGGGRVGSWVGEMGSRQARARNKGSRHRL